MEQAAFWLFFVLLGLSLIWILFLLAVLPALELRAILRRMAGGDLRPVIHSKLSWLFRGTGKDLRNIAEAMEKQRELLSEDGFSLSMILESMEEGVVITGPDLRIRQFNQAAAAMVSLRGSASGLLLSEVFLSHELLALAREALGSRILQRGELSLGPFPGERVRKNLSVTAAPLQRRGGKADIGVLLVLHDITRLRELESVRNRFVADVSHEFRTPLSVIGGYLETLEDKGIGRAMTLKAVKVMGRHVERLNRLIDDLLVISRMEETGLQMQMRSISLPSLLQGIVDQHDKELAAAGARIRLEIQENLPAVTADSYRLEQAFGNLLANALRHGTTAGSEGGGEIVITVTREENGVAVSFQDNGPGIPLADQERLFERFYRVESDRARKTGGTGLGLSIVKGVAEAHGGKVSLRSTPGRGATFTVFLPEKGLPENGH